MATTTEYPDTITWGRCRTGRRFFWTARNLTADTELYDWADTRDQAERQAHVAALKLADGKYAHIRVDHDSATIKLRTLTAAKRKARPSRPKRDKIPNFGYTRADQDNLKALKKIMAACHPDRGGSDAEFIRARERYVRARDLAKTK